MAETVSGRIGELPPASAAEQDFTVRQSGDITISGPGGRTWTVAIVPDRAPSIAILNDRACNRQPFDVIKGGPFGAKAEKSTRDIAKSGPVIVFKGLNLAKKDTVIASFAPVVHTAGKPRHSASACWDAM